MVLVLTKKGICYGAFLCLLLAVAFKVTTDTINKKAVLVSSTENTKAYLTIIIDDFGYSGEGTQDMLSLNVPTVAALMPFGEKSAADVEKINSSGKEMIIHMPMESLTGKKNWVGDKGVFLSLTDEEIRTVVKEGFDIAKGAIGLNNHMGSAIMEDERSLSIVIEEVGKRGLIFVDSKTTPNSKAKEICEKYNVTFLGRDVFLDSTDDIEVVKKQLMLAADIALKNGTAIAIGHVGPEGGNITVEAIKQLAPEIEKMNVEIISLTKMKEVLSGK
ncbi:MAG: divergent polysaccharide deacetylase family protein [Anaerotignaceae bacterium]